MQFLSFRLKLGRAEVKISTRDSFMVIRNGYERTCTIVSSLTVSAKPSRRVAQKSLRNKRERKRASQERAPCAAHAQTILPFQPIANNSGF
jgi:hypothetical protein